MPTEKRPPPAQKRKKYSKKELIIIFVLVILIIIILISFFYIIRSNRIVTVQTETADVVIIGAGTAGCIVARRLSEQCPGLSILVLERGENRRKDPIVYNIKNAAIAGYTAPYSEVLPTDQPNAVASVAKLYGGGSSHNFALAVRGSPAFYNGKWQEQLGLSYQDLAPYFQRVESFHPEFSDGAVTSSSTRYTGGFMQITPLPTNINLLPRILPGIPRIFAYGAGTLGQAVEVVTNTGPLRASDSFSDITKAAIGIEGGVPEVEDYNADAGVCVSKSPQLYVDSIFGVRQSTDVRYLPPSYIFIDKGGRGKNDGLQIVPNATVDKIVESVDRKSELESEKDTFITIIWRDGQGVQKETKLTKRGHVVVATGGIYTPFLLLKSGIVPVRKASEIGVNLMTHYGCTMILTAEATEEENFVFSSGPLAFLRDTKMEPGDDRRMWQLVVSGAGNPNLIAAGKRQSPETSNTRYFTFLLWLLRPKTRGKIGITPGNNTTPKIDLNLYEDEGGEDLASLIRGMRFMRKISDRLKQTYSSLSVVFPPNEAFLSSDGGNDGDLVKFIKQGLSLTDHYCATCALGKVVNPIDFSVYGHPNIHVVDTSVFPEISDGNTAYPVTVMAEIASERIIKALRG